jgi:lysozyme family protein
MTYGAKFEHCFTDLVINEGGYSNASGDRGKRTWFGVSEVFEPGYFARMEAAETDAARLDIARECYHARYWVPLRCDELSLWLAFRLFDAAVLCGVEAATRVLQRACNMAGRELVVDGVLGPKTLSAAISLPERNVIAWMAVFLGEHFLELEREHPGEYTEFLWGWGRRLTDPENPHKH